MPARPPTYGPVLVIDPSKTGKSGLAVIVVQPDLAVLSWGELKLGENRHLYFRKALDAVRLVVAAAEIASPSAMVIETWPGHRSWVVARALSAAQQTFFDVADYLGIVRVEEVRANDWASVVGVGHLLNDTDDRDRKRATQRWVAQTYGLDAPPPEDVADALAMGAAYYGAGCSGTVHAMLAGRTRRKPKKRAPK